MRSDYSCPFLQAHPHVHTLPCQMVEVETTNSRKEKVFCCKFCGQANKIDLEILEEKSLPGIFIILTILLIIFGIVSSSQPEQSSPTPGNNNSQPRSN